MSRTTPHRTALGVRTAPAPMIAAVMAWVVVGGVLYSLGAIVYGTRRPDISPRWFGFHEVFHSLTVLAFAAHVVAASLALSAGTSSA